MEKKNGRPQKNHKNSATGETVNGLTRQHDGRWRLIGTAIKFTEPDEQKAIERFERLKLNDDAEASRVESIEKTVYDGFGKDGRVWKWFAEQIRDRPQWVADQTGIEQIAYLTDLKRPEKLPTFTDLENVWKNHFKKSAEQKRKVLHAWTDFKNTSGVAGLDGITPEVVIAYRDAVYARGVSGKSQSNLFTRIRRLISFAKSRAVAVETTAKVYTTLTLLSPSESTVSLDSQPIDVADYQALLKVAGDEDRAMILLMLNGAFYCAEVIRLKWSDVANGCIVTHRAKEGRCVRVCVLWQETIDALAKVKRKGDFIFSNYAGAPLGIKGAEKRFRAVRDAAEIGVTSSQLRDGAATAMAQANVTEKLCNLLLGHRAGISDHYVKRNSKMVAPCCLAIYAHYFPKEGTAEKPK